MTAYRVRFASMLTEDQDRVILIDNPVSNEITPSVVEDIAATIRSQYNNAYASIAICGIEYLGTATVSLGSREYLRREIEVEQAKDARKRP